MSASPLAAAITRYTDSHPQTDGFYHTDIAPLKLMRNVQQSVASYALYTPTLCMTAQGAKQVMLGDAVFDYGQMEFLVVSLDLPIIARVSQGSEESPYLALLLDIDMTLLQEVIRQMDAEPSPETPSALAIFVGNFDGPAADCALRLVQLLEQPRAIPVLAPSLLRELYYWLLCGPQGQQLRHLVAPNSRILRIAEAIHLMRREFTQAIGIERLATLAGMSVSSFHAHFKAITSVTPLQYQKQLRLLQARRLLATQAANVSQAAYQVGYESPSQFSREYTRMFGAPPSRHAA